MILIDTSAWVEFLRGTNSVICNEVDSRLSKPISICDPVRMEVLAGARNEAHLAQLRRLLARASTLTCEPVDFDYAALLYRTSRREGVTVRKLIDCLIAAIAVRNDVPILHMDADFDALASCTPLRTFDS